MRLASYRAPGAFAGEPGREQRLGVLVGERLVATAELTDGAIATMSDLLADTTAGLERINYGLAASLFGPDSGLGLDEVDLLPPVPRPGKLVCIGVNYRSHADEQDRPPPTSPVIFAKLTTALVGHGATVEWDPELTGAVDAEAELGVVIGRTCRRASRREALDFVLGYTCVNDVSARDLQYADKQFTRAKSLDTFGPMGPLLVTADEVPDPQALDLRGYVNGELRQHAPTSDMIFGVAELIEFCSRAFTLEPGDVIATGTPAGVGWFREPRLVLGDGDEMVVEIEGIGRLANRCRVSAG
ncbi:MAG TPA: fumarylacetoacetate hydrolase family protein [Candidatus Limnocylindrales bacterium]|nr:fumarylacetoacetate hydrolase family protein [Candidatus Limnocylindrales bacterium]